ncbi:MAG: polysaccharide deacetylase family protein [Catenulispora sp.]|nr:polysaccharide deacetylase family protein [Catenulispora sp.]
MAAQGSITGKRLTTDLGSWPVIAPDRRTALRAGLAVLGTAAASAGAAACSDGADRSGPRNGGQSGGRTAAAQGSASGSPSASGAGPSSGGPSSAGPAGTDLPGQAPSTRAPANPPPDELDHASTGRPQVALTFHGDGDPKLAEALLKEAEAAQARLTVLAVGRWLGDHPEMARRVLDGGHELGNHTENHVDITRLAPAAALAEIEACAARLRKLTGSAGVWFRPSQTQHADPVLVEQARRAGYRTVLSYDVDPLDYQDPPSATIAGRLLGAVRPGAVVSLHLGHPGTVQALPEVLAGLKSRGLAAVTASELFS